MQGQNPGLCSPYFSPSFTEIVASTRDNVELAVVKDDGQIVALLPYEKLRWKFAGPVGSFLSDYHGVICRPDFMFQPLDLVRACGLAAWDFEHVPQDQTYFSQFYRRNQRSPIIDLADGYGAYVKERRDAGTEQIKKNGNLMRRLEREVGPLRFVAHSADKTLLDQLLAWKTTQFRHNCWRDIFTIPWVRQTMEGIHSTQTPEFAGVLSALYAGDELVAAHFGMRSATVWHYWFPSYDTAFSKYSPGVMLLLKMAEAAEGLGIKMIDLGCGEHSYKERLMNGYVSTASGSLELTSLTTISRRIYAPLNKLQLKAIGLVRRTAVGNLVRRV